MFIPDTNNVDTALFAQRQMVESDSELWFKQIGQVNYRRLYDLQLK